MLHIDEKLLEIDEEIACLVADLLDSELADVYRLARKNFQEDMELQEMIARLQENLDFIKFRPELRDLQREISLNSKVYALKLAENDLQERLSELGKEICQSISKYILIDENLPFKGGGHHQRRRVEP